MNTNKTTATMRIVKVGLNIHLTALESLINCSAGSEAQYFQMPNRHKALHVSGHATATPCDPIAIGFKLPHIFSLKEK